MRTTPILGLALALASGACGTGGSEPSDGNPPQLAITAPLPGATVSGQVSIDVTAVDDFGVDKVRILVDGTLLVELFTPPFHVTWNTNLLPDNSQHTIRAEAYDVAKNTASQEVHVTILRGPQ